MRLICYPTSGTGLKIVPASAERAWMDETPDSFAYRCLPMNIANAHGWMILNPAAFAAQWDGSAATGAIAIQPLAGDKTPIIASSHFGSGVLTFNVNGLFRTEPGYDLVVTGPVNQPKDAIAPLTGIVETDWSVSTFTMNWKFTRKLTAIRFDRDEPFCMIYPVKRGMIEAIQPEIIPMEQAPEIAEPYTAWAESRRQFNAELTIPNSAAQQQKWQKDYFQGGEVAPEDHRTKIKPKEFKAG
jgi:hypothetical protein